MRINQWALRFFALSLSLSILFLLQATESLAQLAPEVAKQGYADSIFVNGKVVSMDDISRSTSVGPSIRPLRSRATRS